MKRLSALLAIIMIAAMCLAGCGNKKEATNNNNKEVNSENKAEVKIDSQSEEETDEKQSDKEEAPVSEEKPEAKPAEEVKSSTAVNLEAVKNAIITIVGVADPLDVPTSRLSSLYGIDASLVKQSACFVTIEGAFPDEIVMIEAVNEDAASSIKSLLNNRLAEVKEQSKSYDAENYALAQQCSVDKKGLFVTMFLTPQHANMKVIYDGLVK